MVKHWKKWSWKNKKAQKLCDFIRRCSLSVNLYINWGLQQRGSYLWWSPCWVHLKQGPVFTPQSRSVGQIKHQQNTFNFYKLFNPMNTVLIIKFEWKKKMWAILKRHDNSIIDTIFFDSLYSQAFSQVYVLVNFFQFIYTAQVLRGL